MTGADVAGISVLGVFPVHDHSDPFVPLCFADDVHRFVPVIEGFCFAVELIDSFTPSKRQPDSLILTLVGCL